MAFAVSVRMREASTAIHRAWQVLLLETASASPASDIARDVRGHSAVFLPVPRRAMSRHAAIPYQLMLGQVEWAAKQQQQTARAAAQRAAAQRAPAPQHSVDMDQVIVQHFLRR